jgi:hypothetical protein
VLGITIGIIMGVSHCPKTNTEDRTGTRYRLNKE